MRPAPSPGSRLSGQLRASAALAPPGHCVAAAQPIVVAVPVRDSSAIPLLPYVLLCLPAQSSGQDLGEDAPLPGPL